MSNVTAENTALRNRLVRMNVKSTAIFRYIRFLRRYIFPRYVYTKVQHGRLINYGLKDRFSYIAVNSK